MDFFVLAMLVELWKRILKFKYILEMIRLTQQKNGAGKKTNRVLINTILPFLYTSLKFKKLLHNFYLFSTT